MLVRTVRITGSSSLEEANRNININIDIDININTNTTININHYQLTFGPEGETPTMGELQPLEVSVSGIDIIALRLCRGCVANGQVKQGKQRMRTPPLPESVRSPHIWFFKMIRSTVAPPTFLQRNRRFQNQLPVVSPANTESLDTPTSSIVRPLHTRKYMDNCFQQSPSLCRAAMIDDETFVKENRCFFGEVIEE